MKNLVHEPFHAALLNTINGLNLAKPSDLTALAGAVRFAHSVPASHRHDVLSAIDTATKTLAGKEKTKARTAALKSLGELKSCIRRTQPNPTIAGGTDTEVGPQMGVSHNTTQVGSAAAS